MTRPRAFLLACLTALALLGFFEFPGHTWLYQDTQIWAPMLEHVWDPTALHQDLVAGKPHFAFTIYDEAAIGLRWITRASFHAVLVFEQILCRILELLGVFLLARAFGLVRRNALFVAACFGLGATIVGPSVLTFEYEPVPRGFALGFLFLAAGLAARGTLVLAGIAAGVGFLFHPPTAVPIGILLVLIAIWRRNYRGLIPLAGAVVLLLVMSRFQAGATESQPFLGSIDPGWEGIERLRASYNWISVWINPLIWQYVFFAALTMIGVWRLGTRCGRVFSIGLPVIGLLSLPVSYIFTEKLKWDLMPQVQPARCLLWVTAMAVIIAAAAAARAAERRIWWEAILWFTLVFAVPLQARIADITPTRLALAVGLAVLASGVILMGKHRGATAALAIAIVIPYFAIPLAGRVQNYPHLRTPALEALATWARTATPKQATFLFPDAGRALDPGFFRADSLRSVYVDWKAGGQVNYFRSLAEEWSKRWEETMSGKDIPANLARFRQVGIDYIVMRKNDPIAGLTPVFANESYLVYQLTT